MKASNASVFKPEKVLEYLESNRVNQSVSNEWQHRKACKNVIENLLPRFKTVFNLSEAVKELYIEGLERLISGRISTGGGRQNFTGSNHYGR